MRKIIGLSLILIATSSYAYEGHGFRIISEKETHSAAWQAGFTPLKKPLTRYGKAYANAYNAEGKIGNAIKVEGGHSVGIENETDHPLRYTYIFEIKCNAMTESFERTVELESHGRFTDSGSTYGNVQSFSVGQYGITATTRLHGGDSDFAMGNANLIIHR